VVVVVVVVVTEVALVVEGETGLGKGAVELVRVLERRGRVGVGDCKAWTVTHWGKKVKRKGKG
jgi:hypothetical protein